MSLSVEDRLDIQELYARYNHAIDSGQAEQWAACFSEDGVFDSGASGRFEGREALAGFAKGFAERLKARHWTNNLVVEADGEGARGTCYLILYALGGEPKVNPIVTGIYRDRLVRTAAGWRFAERTVKVDA